MVDLFEQIKVGVEFPEAANTLIPGGKVVNIANLLILRKGRMQKACVQWEYMQVGLKTWQGFKEHFSQAYRRYRIHKKVTVAAHGYSMQQVIHMIQRPKSTLRMRYNHTHVQQWATSRKCQTSPASTSHYLRS